MAGLQMVLEVLLVDVILGTKGALDVPGDVLLAATIPAKTRLLMGNTVLFGIELLVTVLAVHNISWIMGLQMAIQPALAGVTFVTVIERSQNAILLASTQAVYKAPHSTVRESFKRVFWRESFSSSSSRRVILRVAVHGSSR